ncbi:shikimate dehydrogenase [Streptomyces sp. TP-A0356]|uniref:shikimate dehydrogenase n=1 Tax=Streptomyces sp. TP-A0356 TaxID=1359208 RepID=UPI0006E3B8ED|nr:shikimate dehydrogenase [Streptomyces sp. TP-A0356]
MKRLAILGSPISGALSPVLHRAAYTALGLDWRYEAIECSPDQLPSHFAKFATNGQWAGLSLTMPLKRAAVPLLDDVSHTVTVTGTANTVVVREGRLVGDNTDVAGMERALREAGVEAPEDAAVLGAGATAASALAVLSNFGLQSALVVARAPSRIRELRAAAERLGMGLQVVGWDRAVEAFQRKLVVSALPPYAADTLVTAAAGGRCGTLMDVVYRPWPTVLGSALHGARVVVIGGLPMLVHQAARQVELQTGCETPPHAQMLEAAIHALQGRRSESTC